MERTCDHCGQPYRRPESLIGRYCSRECHYAAARRERTGHRRMRRHPDHPLAGKTGLVSEARALLFDRIGWGPHPCHWCGKRVDWLVGQRGNLPNALVADHVDSDPLNDDAANIVAACGPCNAQRARTVNDEETYVVRGNGTRLRVGEQRSCRTCATPFLTTVTYRNYCSRACTPSRKARTA